MIYINKAAGKLGIIFILSTNSSTSMEEVARQAPDTHKWYQLYISKDREFMKSMVRRAEASNFKAIVNPIMQLSLPNSAQKFNSRNLILWT